MQEKMILYTSNAGHAEAYAQLLSKELGLSCFRLGTEKVERGAKVIFLGWLMAGSVSGLKKALSLYEVTTIAIVGMAAFDEKNEKEVVEKYHLATNQKVFYLQGGFEMDKLKGLYKFMMGIMKKTVGKSLKKKADKTPEEQDMLDMLLNGRSCVKKENLSSLIAWVTR